MTIEKPIDILVKDYIKAVIWAWKELGEPNPEKWNWTVIEIGRLGKFTFIKAEDAMRFKLVWG
jgi:hypothetical protein